MDQNMIEEYAALVKQQQGELIDSQKQIQHLQELVEELYRQLELSQHKYYDC
jgi:Leu/Phe-tRNA-protein transferase